MSVAPLVRPPQPSISDERSSASPDPIGAQLPEYNTAPPMALLASKQLREAITVPMAGGSFRFLYSTPLDAGNPKFVVNAAKSPTSVAVTVGGSTTKPRWRIEVGGPRLTLSSSLSSYSHYGHCLSMA
jgi:hypothetical protein